MPNKNNVDKKISYANGDDNVIPIGPIPHEKPWYETDEGKKLIAKTSKSELIEMLGGLTGKSEKLLKGMSFKKFVSKRVPDSEMKKLRKQYFN